MFGIRRFVRWLFLPRVAPHLLHGRIAYVRDKLAAVRAELLDLVAECERQLRETDYILTEIDLREIEPDYKERCPCCFRRLVGGYCGNKNCDRFIPF